MGTTLTAGTMAAGDVLLVGHVGDSRAYLARDHALARITADHSVVAELVQAGELTEDQAELDPRRSMITRALGVDRGVDVDVYTVELRAGDRVLLCSDGLTAMVREDQILAILGREVDPTRAARALVAAANDNGGIDNITCVVVDAVEDPSVGDVPALVDAAPAAFRDEDDATAMEGGAFDDTQAIVIDPAEPAVAVAATTRRGRRGLRLPPEPEPGDGPVEDPEVVKAEQRADRRAARRARAGVTWRVLRWVLPVLLIVGIAFGVVAWYARNRFYVGTNQGQVTIYRGVPGGLLVWDPTIENRTKLDVSDLTAAQRADVHDGKKFSSESDAQAYVARLRSDERRRTTPTTAITTTTTSTTTTTTVPVATTPTPAP